MKLHELFEQVERINHPEIKTVWKNPSLYEYNAVLDKFQCLRGFKLSDGNSFIWNGYSEVHSAMYRWLGYDSSNKIYTYALAKTKKFLDSGYPIERKINGYFFGSFEEIALHDMHLINLINSLPPNKLT